MAKAETGNKVKVHYKGSLKDGTVFDDSREREPLEFEIGGGTVIPGFEKAVVGMEPGETKEVTVPPGEAYGDYDEKLRFVFEKSQFPDDLELKPGLRLNMKGENGKVAVFTVVDVLGDEVVLDGNHPLVGRELVFDIELMEIL